MTSKATSSPGKGAPIDKQGHTTTGQYGVTDKPSHGASRKSPRELNLK